MTARMPGASDGNAGPEDPNEDPEFLEALEKAKALSLETLELDKIRRQRLTADGFYGHVVVALNDGGQGSQGGALDKPKASEKVDKTANNNNINVSNNNQNIAAGTVDARSRPRPGTSRQTSVNSLLPPPARRGVSVGTAGNVGTTPTAAATSKDLISFLDNDTTESKRSEWDFDPLCCLMAYEKKNQPDDVSTSSAVVPTSLVPPATSVAISSTVYNVPLVPGPTMVTSTAAYGAQTVASFSQAYSPLQGPLPLSQWNFPPPVAAAYPSLSVPARIRSPLNTQVYPHRPVTSAVGPLQPSFPNGTIPMSLSILQQQLSKPSTNGNLIDLFSLSGTSPTGGKRALEWSSEVDNSKDVLSCFDPLMSKEAEETRQKRMSGSHYKLWESETASPSDFPVSGQSSNISDTAEGDSKAPPVPLRTHSSETAQSVAATDDEDEPEVIFRTHRRFGKQVSLSYEQRCSRIHQSMKFLTERKGGNAELEAFRDTVVRLRRQYTYDDYLTNVGFVISPTLESLREESTSIQLVIHSKYTEKPISFKCDVTTNTDHVLSNIVFTIFDDVSNVNLENYVLKVHGVSEYFAADTALVDYECVHFCQKFDEDVHLTLVETDGLQRPLARTAQDDENDTAEITSSKLLPSKGHLSQKDLAILTETLDKQVEMMKKDANSGKATGIKANGVTQAVKAICAILAHVETKELRGVIEDLNQVVAFFSSKPIDRDVPAEVQSEMLSDALTRSIAADIEVLPNIPGVRMTLLMIALERVKEAVMNLIHAYCRCFFVDFPLPLIHPLRDSVKPITAYDVTFLVHVNSVHRIKALWSTSYQYFVISCELYHGTRLLADAVETKQANTTMSFNEQIIFDEWLEISHVLLCVLPRESRLCLTLYGVRTVTSEGVQNIEKESLGWATLQLFSYDGELMQGVSLCGMWPETEDKRLGPAISNTQDNNCCVLQISLPDFGCAVIFPEVIHDSALCRIQKRDFETLYTDMQQKLLDIIEKSSSSSNIVEDREILWEKRHYLYDIPQALPKVLLAAHSWHWSCLADLHLMIREWKPMSAVDALELLLPCFPDIEVRKTAISWIRNMSSDELCDYLPQMVQSLKSETYDDSPTAAFLIERSLTSIRVMHHLYWLLKQNVDDLRCGRRIQLVLNALLCIAGKAMREKLAGQEDLMKKLSKIASKIKETKESLRMSVLLHELEITNNELEDTQTNLPLGPSLEVCGIDLKGCYYYVSNTIPIKLSFKTLEEGAKPIEAIFKEGDDLRQDMLTLSMIRIMDKLWLKEGLDLRVVTFGCIPTGYKKGIVEMVKGSETLRKIQVEHGLTGSFKDHPIADWLQKHNPSELEYQQAVENFTYSCAGYSVATYILGVCDRHNDNIMIKTSGHIFHIDFGKFLGDSQMFGGIKRDRVPFVLTSDMAYVINGGDKPSSKFQNFVDICCSAFNIIRKHGNLFLNLFGLMVTARIPGVTTEAVRHIQSALMMDKSDDQASIEFTRMIEESLKSWFTQFNFFIHNLAQFRFSGEQNSEALLSFMPRTYTMETDGKIKCVEVIGYEKRHDPEKHYVYIIKVQRHGTGDDVILYRSYGEFCEFHQKMCTRFPLAKYHSLPKVYLGRSNIRQVTEKRKAEIANFLNSMWSMADEVKHCELVYTFFHPLLRDQQDNNQQWPKAKDRCQSPSAGFITGQIKLSIHYKTDSLFVMIMHARNLSEIKGQPPDTYVKTYLLPEQPHNRNTKRKTKVVRRSCHPTFMEMLVYRLPLEVVRQRMLQVSVWNYGLVAENAFLGAVGIDLSQLDLKKQTANWHHLGNILHR